MKIEKAPHQSKGLSVSINRQFTVDSEVFSR